MKVRDLRQYIKSISKGTETLELVGTDRENFLTEMSGRGQKVSGLITSAASFANNAEEQLFYEFVQNAYDASADTLLFYANEEYLIVLNNGEPFFTDLDIFDLPEGEEPRDGQLYNFLAKGKSLKLEDQEKLGKYGQGSKLLYTLLADINHKANTEDLLKEAIIKNKKGPYLVSWHNMSQLDAWLINGDEWIPAQADDIENNILFAKILMSYYPIAPGQDLEKFTNEEAQSAIRAFETLVDPKRNKSFLTRGTALIIPLGKGKYNAIIAEKNIENVRSRLGDFASITGNQERNAGKKLQHIYVMGSEVEQYPVQSVFVDFEEEGNNFHYHFAFNPLFAEKNVVNFFKGLPILQTKYRFGFILDSQTLEVDDSRQRISYIDKTCDQLRGALKHLVDKLKDIYETDREKFDYIYQSIISSRPEQNSEEDQKIRKAFYDIIRPFLNEYAYTTEGIYVGFEQVCEEEKEVNILLKDLGINNLHWIDADSRRKYVHHFSQSIRVLKFSEMLRMANAEKLIKWIKGMSVDEYKQFHQHSLSVLSEVSQLAIFRTNKNNLYSWTTLRSNCNVYYMEQGMEPVFIDQEYVLEPMCAQYGYEDCSVLYEKITNNLETLRTTSVGTDAVCQMLCYLVKSAPTYANVVKNQVAVLQNWRGEYKPFSELLEDRPEGTILFDNFRIKGAVPDCIKQQDWLVDKRIDKNIAIWEWITHHFEEIKKEDGWGIDTEFYLKDIQKVYKLAGETNTTKLRLYLNEEGIPVDTICHTIDNYNKLSEEEYEKLQVAYSTYTFVPHKYQKVLTNAPFTLSTLHVSDLIDPNQSINVDTLSILSKISQEGILQKYRIIGKDNKFYLSQLNGGKNYIGEVDESIRSALTNIGFYYIPKEVRHLIPHGSNAFNITRDDFALSIINKIDDKLLIYPIIRNCSSIAINQYFNSLTCISIDNKLSKSDVRWQLIEFAVRQNTEENKFKHKVFESILHKRDSLPETIKDNIIIAFGNQYNLYALDSDYQVENEQIDSFLSCLPTDMDAQWFKDEFYGDKKEEVSIINLYDSLKETYLNVEQLRFCLDYSLHSAPDYYNLEIDPDEENLSDALDMIKANNFVGFDEFFKIEGFDAEEQVFADTKLLVEEEKLPDDLYEWLNANRDALILFKNLRTESDPYISIRSGILNNSEGLFVPEFDDSSKAANTIEWLKSANITYVYGENAFDTIMRIVGRQIEDVEEKVFLQYTGDVVLKESIKSAICPTFTLNAYENNSCFWSLHSWSQIALEMLKENKDVQHFFKQEKVYLYDEAELLTKHKLHKAAKLDVQVKAHDGNYTEIISEPYQKWKDMPESRGILIKTSKERIGINFTILKKGELVLSVEMDDKDFGYHINKMVVVQYPNKEKLSPLKMIEKHIGDMEFFHQPFIVLQGLYVEQMEHLELLAEEKGTDINTIIQAGGARGGRSKGNLQVPEDKLDAIKGLMEQLNAEELAVINERMDDIRKALQAMDEEEPTSMVRATIGYIGEQIYDRYLTKRGIPHEYVAEHEGEYDFKVKQGDETVYVDVKTNLYSLEDGTAPFYIHKSQSAFMQKHPDAKFRIVRVSLKDINIEREYTRIKEIYGTEADPATDTKLQKECQKIADKYWRGASIDVFDAKSPEYGLSITRMKS